MNQRMIVALTTTLVSACAPLRPPSGGASPIEYELLQPQRDSFVVVSRGRAVGFQRTNLERTPSGYRLHDEVQVEGDLLQTTELEFTDNSSLRSVTQNGDAGRQPTRITLEYIGDGARGSATTLSAGWTARAIDVAMPAEEVDDNLLTMLVPMLTWSRESRYTINMSRFGLANAASYRLAVVGTQRVTVPSGTYDSYEVELTGDVSQRLLLNVTAARPHRVVRIVPAGQLVEFLLASSRGGTR